MSPPPSQLPRPSRATCDLRAAVRGCPALLAAAQPVTVADLGGTGGQ